MSNKRVRSISFNSKNEQDILRTKLIGKKPFSRYIKRLLDEELKRTKVLTPTTTKTATPPIQSRIQPIANSRPLTPKKFNAMLQK